MNAFGVVGPSDLLRTGGAVFLITRKSKLAKVLGYLWLAGEIYSLAQKERGLDPFTGRSLATGTTPTEDALMRFTGKAAPRPPQSGDGLAKPAFAGFLGYAL